MSQFRIIPLAKRAYRGKRARRQAFYERQRLARMLERISRTVSWGLLTDDYANAMRDMVTAGVGLLTMLDGTLTRSDPTILWDRADGRGFTDEPLREGEWPRAMKRTWSIEP